MSLIKYFNKRIRNLDWIDIGLVKVSVAAFILMAAKLWTPLLRLNWYWYGLIFLLAMLRPFYRVYLK